MQGEAECAMRRIAILMFDGCSLLGAGGVAEVFHAANEIAGTGGRIYSVRFLSADGGHVSCSSSIRVWTDGFDTQHFGDFDALFVAGGRGARIAAGQERLIGWLRRVCATTKVVMPIVEGRLLLDAAGIDDGGHPFHDFGALGQDAAAGFDHDASNRIESMRCALAVIRRDLGLEIARSVAERLMPGASARFGLAFGDRVAASPRDKIREAARWLKENCDRPISVADAAQVAAMSERNFLRRFKLEMGLTPSDFLLHMRLSITCSLLIESDLPVDKIARRCGMGNGDRLAKIFRKRMHISPTEYRLQGRQKGGK